MSTTPVKMIKKDAIINIGVGTGFLYKLQQAQLFMLQERTPEEQANYATLLEKNALSEPWMEHLTTISALIREIEVQAEKSGQTYEDILPEVESNP